MGGGCGGIIGVDVVVRESWWERGDKKGGRIVALVKCIDHPWHSFSKLKQAEAS